MSDETLQESFGKLLHFSERINDLKLLKRKIFLHDQQTLEDDAQHSFDVAMTCFYLYCTHLKELSLLSLEKVLLYALVHDFLEVYAGDVDLVTGTEAEKERAAKNEVEALGYVKDLFQEIPYLHTLIVEYEAQASEEARFVKAVNRLVATLMESNNGFYTCRLKRVTPEEFEKINQGLLLHPVVASYLPHIQTQAHLYKL